MPVVKRQQKHCSLILCCFFFFYPFSFLAQGKPWQLRSFLLFYRLADRPAGPSRVLCWSVGLRPVQTVDRVLRISTSPTVWLRAVLCCTGVLEVLQCALVESPEVISVFKEGHIQSIISFLEKHGRNHKVDVWTVWVVGSRLGAIVGAWYCLFTSAETILSFYEKSPLINELLIDW